MRNSLRLGSSRSYGPVYKVFHFVQTEVDEDEEVPDVADFEGPDDDRTEAPSVSSIFFGGKFGRYFRSTGLQQAGLFDQKTWPKLANFSCPFKLRGIRTSCVVDLEVNLTFQEDIISVQPSAYFSTPVTTEPKSANAPIPLPPPSPKATVAVRPLQPTFNPM